MKYRTTQKAVKEGYYNTISIGYCNMQHLLNYFSEVAYTTRREGWAADIYEFGNTAIITGYAPFGKIHPAYDVVQEYDRKAAAIDYHLSWEERKAAAMELVREFIEEVTKNENHASENK